eukprot:c6207_g1_i1.p1 GENE.c6207_g1_i1~~c6207_g1_i1.p1  ORF type:complete len:565 (+),score=96.14 c6207_g1_i1:152-1846(+)
MESDNRDLPLAVITIQTALDDLFRALVDEDSNVRATSIEIIVEDLQLMLASPQGPLETCLGSEEAKLETFQIIFIKAALRTLSRVTNQSPFEDVRSAMHQLLTESIKQTEQLYPGVSEGIIASTGWLSSRHISVVSEPSLNSPANPEEILRSIFMQTGRITHVERLMAWHPAYLSQFQCSLNNLLHMPGPLPFEWRLYLCILAAAQHNCGYLVEQLMRDFLVASGDREWLSRNCLQVIPPKLAAILELNSVLAHQPWLISRSHMEELMRGGAKSWSIAELVHALMILATFHGLAGFVFGLGIYSEVDGIPQILKLSTKQPNPRPTPSPTIGVVKRAADGEHKTWNTYLEETMSVVNEFLHEMAPEEQSKCMASALESDTDTDAESLHYKGVAQNDHISERFVGSHTMAHMDFDVKNNTVIRSVNWSWNENAYETARHVLPDAAAALDAQFSFIQVMTDRSINGIDTGTTAPFRNAVWFYTHRMFGIIHDDYNYQLLNKLLPRKLKHYIKRVACTPREVNPRNIEDVDVDLQPQERVHVLLLVMEARKQAELLFALNMLMTYKNG